MIPSRYLSTRKLSDGEIQIFDNFNYESLTNKSLFYYNEISDTEREIIFPFR